MFLRMSTPLCVSESVYASTHVYSIVCLRIYLCFYACLLRCDCVSAVCDCVSVVITAHIYYGTGILFIIEIFVEGKSHIVTVFLQLRRELQLLNCNNPTLERGQDEPSDRQTFLQYTNGKNFSHDSNGVQEVGWR